MSHDLIYELLVGAGIFLLLFAGLVLLAGCVDPARGEAAIQDAGRDAHAPGDSHRLSVSIAEALVQNRIVEPANMTEVARIVALKIELQNAMGSPLI